MFFFSPEKGGFPRHVAYVILLSIVLFAGLSGSIPAFQVLSAEKLKEQQMVKAVIGQKTESLSATNTTIRKSQHAALKREQLRGSTSLPVLQDSENVIVAVKGDTNRNLPEVSLSVSGESQKHIFDALNRYRAEKGKSPLSWDTKLGNFAQSRSELFLRESTMDDHAGFQTMFENNGPSEMGFMKMGENSSKSDTTDAVYIIESLYAGSPGHEANQLHDEYTHVGIGVSGIFTDLVFGGRKR